MFDINKCVRPCILARKEYVPGKPVEEVQRELGISDLTKLASNENPLGVSPKALEAMIEELRRNAQRYPESLCHDLRYRLAEQYRVDPEGIFIDNGEDGIITMIGLTFINPGEEALFGGVTFPAYENIVTKMDGICVPIPMTADYRLDLDAFARAVNPRTKIMFVCNPNNPTGTIVLADEFQRLLETVPENVLIVVDEAYYEFADNPASPDSLSHLAKHPNLIILRSFSKIMGMAGIRVGYTLAHSEVVKVMLKAREPFPVNRAAQAGALAAMDDIPFIEETLELNRRGREQLYAAFEKLGLTYYPTQTNFVMLELDQPAQPVFEAMLREGVIIRPLTSQGLEKALRITIGTEADNQRMIEALTKTLSRKLG